MIAFALYDRKHDECDRLKTVIRESMAYLSDEGLRLDAYEKADDFMKIISNGSVFDMACLDITGENGILMAENFRKMNQNSMIMLIAASEMSPMEYIRPSIMAAGLMLRPYESSKDTTIYDFIRNYLTVNGSHAGSELVVETRDDILRIPFDKIYYIEAKDKKVFIRILNEEYGYYNTLDSLIKDLPDMFVRCHRGYIVNKNKIKRVINAENLLELDGEIYVPVSRSLKKVLKELLK